MRIDNPNILMDSTQMLQIQQVVHLPFHSKKQLELRDGTVIWLKQDIRNHSNANKLLLEIKNPLLEKVTFYTVANGQVSNIQTSGLKYPFSQREYKVSNFLYTINVPIGKQVTVYLQIYSDSVGEIPLYIGKEKPVFNNMLNRFLLAGIYYGIVFIMFFYNMFIYITVKDKNYLYYVVYIFSIGLTQMILNGYAFMYLWPNNTWLAINSINLSGIFSGVMTLLFARDFLNTRHIVPRLHKILGYLILLDLVAIGLSLFIDRLLAFNIINIVAITGSIFTIFSAYLVSKKNFRPAKFFFGAFSIFLVAVIIYVLRTENYIEHNNFTSSILEIGSAIQILLLSFALADKINTYRKEQNIARKEALHISKENERLVKEQNITLEQQVHERTLELEESNETLNETLSQLKEAQSKMVESEKMVSLGQLTSGIAHEINNPINFVTANVKPLELDIKDLLSIIRQYEAVDLTKSVPEQFSSINTYKKQIDIDYIIDEIKTLLSGIKDGAQRTAEIVSNLKNFARTDENNIKPINLNEGLESTLLLVRNSFPIDFILDKKLGNIPSVECTPGKINQVFMNIITNGLQAITERQATQPGTGILTLKTFSEGAFVKVSIKDNGMGLKESVKEKIFEPFFTTKPVGQGTGLGMSIVRSIIESHKGVIEVRSNFGEGAEFIITLPIKYLN